MHYSVGKAVFTAVPMDRLLPARPKQADVLA